MSPSPTAGLGKEWFTAMADTEDEGLAEHARYIAYREMAARANA